MLGLGGAYWSILRIGRQGLPTANEFAGMSRVTTLPAPITQLSPMITFAQSRITRLKLE